MEQVSRNRVPRPAAILLDIGGTLWPDAFAEDPALRVRRLAHALPQAYRDRAGALAKELERVSDELRGRRDNDLSQDTLGLVSTSLHRLQIPFDRDLADRIRSAMVVPASPGRLFPGASGLLATIHELGVRLVAVSNTFWRSARDYARDFDLNGVGEYFDAILTSLDEGVRKPDRRIFERALSVAGTDAERTVVIGNSERMDIQPGTQLGMRTIFVAIEQAPPSVSSADAVVESLLDLRQLLVAWLSDGVRSHGS